MEKDFETVWLLDAYAGLLTEKQFRLCDMYYNQDYSLSEIAQIENTTRQAARDGIGKARQRLNAYENCLGLCAKKAQTLNVVDKAANGEKNEADMKKALNEIAEIWGGMHGI